VCGSLFGVRARWGGGRGGGGVSVSCRGLCVWGRGVGGGGGGGVGGGGGGVVCVGGCGWWVFVEGGGVGGGVVCVLDVLVLVGGWSLVVRWGGGVWKVGFCGF